MNYKYSEFTEKEFSHWCNKYSGDFIYPYELEIGTKVYAEIGNWYGEIIEEDEEKFILIENNTKIKLTPYYYLWASISIK